MIVGFLFAWAVTAVALALVAGKVIAAGERREGADREEREFLIRAALSRTPADLSLLDRSGSEADARVLRATQPVDQGVLMREIAEHLEQLGDENPLVPEGL